MVRVEPEKIKNQLLTERIIKHKATTLKASMLFEVKPVKNKFANTLIQ